MNTSTIVDTENSRPGDHFWTTPTDYQTDEVERHELPSLKGMTEPTLPELGEPTA